MIRHVIVVDCPRPVMTSNDQRKWHYRQQAQAVSAMQQQILTAPETRLIAPQSDSIGIRVTWYPPNRIVRDHDALNPFMKAAQDALVKSGVLADDSSRHVAWGTTAIGPVDKTRPRIEVEIVPAAWCWVCDRTCPPPPVCGADCDTSPEAETADRMTREDHS